MLKFIGGLVMGVALAFGYVQWAVSLPAIFGLPDQMKGNLISTATEEILYNLDRPMAARLRALEVFFQNRPKTAVRIDVEFANAFLNNLYRKRVIREARQLRMAWSAYDQLLKKPALRKAQERKFGLKNPIALKQALLMDAFTRKTFIAQWAAHNEKTVTKQNIHALIIQLSKAPF